MDRIRTMNPYLASFLAISLDYGSTKYALSQGAVESNSFMVSHSEAKKAFQIAITGLGIRVIEKRNKKAAKGVKIGLFIANGIIAGINIRNGIRAK